MDKHTTPLDSLFEAAQSESARLDIADLMASVDSYPPTASSGFLGISNTHIIMSIITIISIGLLSTLALNSDESQVPTQSTLETVTSKELSITPDIVRSTDALALSDSSASNDARLMDEQLTESETHTRIEVADITGQIKATKSTNSRQASVDANRRQRFTATKTFNRSRPAQFASRPAGSDTANGREVFWIITELTTDEEMREIQRQAIAAGIDFSYKMKGKGDKRQLKRFRARIPDVGLYNLVTSGDFNMYLGWIVDERGQAIDFYDGPEERTVEEIEDLFEEISEDLERRIEELSASFESQSEELKRNMAGERRALSSALQDLEREKAIAFGRMLQELENDEEVIRADDSYLKRKQIVFHRDTDSADFEKLVSEAAEARVVLSQAKEEGKLVYTITAVRANGVESTQRVKVNPGDNWEIAIGWLMDMNGQFLRFLTSDEMD